MDNNRDIQVISHIKTYCEDIANQNFSQQIAKKTKKSARKSKILLADILPQKKEYHLSKLFQIEKVTNPESLAITGFIGTLDET